MNTYNFSAPKCIEAFLDKMREKAELIGLSDKTVFRDPCGIDNEATPRDVLKWLIFGSKCEKLQSIWSAANHTVEFKGENSRKMEIISTVVADAASHVLTDYYNVLGGKTGTLKKHSAWNLAFIAQVADCNELFACVIMYAEEPNTQMKNRFQAAKEAMDIAVKKYKNRSLDVSKETVCAGGAIVAAVDENGEDFEILFEQNGDDMKVPASMTKILTASVGIEYIKDTKEKITVRQEVLDIIPKYFYVEDFKAGDEVRISDILHAMMLPSSNAAAYILAEYAGNIILS